MTVKKKKTVEERIERGKHEILGDVRDGTVPETVGSFSELHDYVDANYYGGWIDDADEELELSRETDLPDINKQQDALDAWIKTGALKGHGPSEYHVGLPCSIKVHRNGKIEIDLSIGEIADAILNAFESGQTNVETAVEAERDFALVMANESTIATFNPPARPRYLCASSSICAVTSTSIEELFAHMKSGHWGA